MKVIHCTNKLITKLDIIVQPKDNNHINQGIGDWYSNIFEHSRKQHLVFINTKTLISFVVPHVLKKDLKNYQDLFMNGLRSLLLDLNVESELIDKIFIEYIHLQIAKTESKRIIGFMNDVVQDYKYIFTKDSVYRINTIKDFNININKKPIKALDYKFPIEVFKELILSEYS